MHTPDWDEILDTILDLVLLDNDTQDRQQVVGES